MKIGILYSIVVVILVYDYEYVIGVVVVVVCGYGLFCILVDDGSSCVCVIVLQQLVVVELQYIMLLVYLYNQGKGGVVMIGLCYVVVVGYIYVLQIDVDGQYDSVDILCFLVVLQVVLVVIINGKFIYDESVFKGWFYVCYLIYVWVWINMFLLEIVDLMCGFWFYLLVLMLQLMDQVYIGWCMDFDIEILVCFYWCGLCVQNFVMWVCYLVDGVLYFQVWLDNVLILCMYVCLFFGMLLCVFLLLVCGSWCWLGGCGV